MKKIVITKLIMFCSVKIILYEHVCSEFFLLVQKVVDSCAMIELFIFDALNYVVKVVSVQFLYFLRLL